jgi:uncharacterized protein
MSLEELRNMRRRDVLSTGFGAAALSALPLAALSEPARKKPLGQQIAEAGEAQAGITLYYDPTYVRLAYPMGDVPMDRGVCADVVIRALRSTGMDLQAVVNQDMRADFAAYPKVWGLKKPDRNIDHRRVLNLETLFRRKGGALDSAAPLQAGDFVTWRLPGNLPHIGIVSTRMNADKTRPLIAHNVGAGAQVEDVLDAWPIKGRFRYPARV